MHINILYVFRLFFFRLLFVLLIVYLLEELTLLILPISFFFVLRVRWSCYGVYTK